MRHCFRLVLGAIVNMSKKAGFCNKKRRKTNFTHPDIVKILDGIIDDACKNISKYCKNPGIDFTRNRKLPASTLVRAMISMKGQTLNKELYDLFNRRERMSSSAFIQQREKLKAEIFLFIMKELNKAIEHPITLMGHRLVAIDGSDFITPLNKDSKWYIANTKERKDGQNAIGSCQMHANLAFDILNKIYIDCEMGRNERDAALKMIDRCEVPSIFVMDRGYTGYNMIEHCNRSDHFYVIRFTSRQTIREIEALPDKAIDTDMEIKVSTKSKKFCDLYGYKKINVRKNKKAKDLYSDSTKDKRWDFEDKCVIKFRVVKFRINNSDSGKPEWEILITNIPRSMAAPNAMKEIYHKRWGIETSIRELKYPVGAVNFHSIKDDFLLQELFAHLVVFNAAAIAALQIPIIQDGTIHPYAINFTMCVHIYRQYYRSKAPPGEMYAEMELYREPVREGRHDTRRMNAKGPVYFTYRVA